MILILASPWDSSSASLATRWGGDCSLLSCRDLSRVGWRCHDGALRGESRIVAGGQVVAESEVRGVLVRTPSVTEGELVHIDPSERSYVAQEMTAFLRGWLTRLECPVVNRPSTGSLGGPAWRPERWVQEAAQLGIPVRGVHRVVPPAPPGGDAREDPVTTTVTVVGGRALGPASEILKDRALRLAGAAGVELLAVRFRSKDADPTFLDATAMPDLEDGATAAAVLELLRGAARTVHA